MTKDRKKEWEDFFSSIESGISKINDTMLEDMLKKGTSIEAPLREGLYKDLKEERYQWVRRPDGVYILVDKFTGVSIQGADFFGG